MAKMIQYQLRKWVNIRF